MLTREMIAAAFPQAAADDRSAMPLMSEADMDASRAATLAAVAPSEDVWLFAYGSLMWNPDIEYADRIVANLQGWHRSFCLWQWRYRGSKERPGLMMALDVGGTCTGQLFRIPGPDASERLKKIWRREMIGRAYRPIWIWVETAAETVRALTFVADRESHRYAGTIPEEEAAQFIATACGHIGSNAEYLLETYLHCDQCGIDDPILARMQKLVADELMRNRAEP